MGKVKTFLKLISKPAKMRAILMSKFARTKLSHIVKDKAYIKMQYRANTGHKLDLKNPVTYTDKINYIKLYDRNPTYISLVDKYEVKKYISDTIGEQYVINTLGVWDSVDDIDWDSLPNQFVIKCTHDSGSTIVCKDKANFDIEFAKNKLSKKMKYNLYCWAREWAYKDVKPRIMAEQYMEDTKTAELRVYKFFCTNGEAKALFIATERQKKGEEVKFDFFDMEFNHLPMKNGHPNASVPPARPEKFDEMRILAGKLSMGLPQVRVDFYEVDGQVYFGELTFYHHAGIVDFTPHEWNVKFGEFVDLSLIKNK